MTPRTIGFPWESGSGERRTLLTTYLARTLIEAGYRVLAEPGLGSGIGQPDRALAEVGVEFADPDRVWASPLVLRYKPGPHQDLRRLVPGQAIGAIFHAEGDPHMLTALTHTEVRAYSYEFWHENDHFPLASAGATSLERWRCTPELKHYAAPKVAVSSWTTSPALRVHGWW